MRGDALLDLGSLGRATDDPGEDRRLQPLPLEAAEDRRVGGRDPLGAKERKLAGERRCERLPARLAALAAADEQRRPWPLELQVGPIERDQLRPPQPRLDEREQNEPVTLALDRERVSYVIIGGFARVVHGSGEVTDGLDIAPSLRDENLRRLQRALGELGVDEAGIGEQLVSREPVTAETRAGVLRIVPEPWGTRGYGDLRIRAGRENLGRGARPAVASVVDSVRMLDASDRDADGDRLLRLRRLMELERELAPSRGLRVDI